MFLSLVCSENLGIRYEDVISKWVNYEKRRMRDGPLGVSPSSFTIENGMPKSRRLLDSKTIWNPVRMFEDDFEGLECKGVLKKISRDGDSKYLSEGYETLLDESGINYLCLSTAVRPLRISIEGITNVAIGYRGYFDEQKAQKLGECLSRVLNGMEVCVIPESLCGLVSKLEHVGEDVSLHCMVIMTSGRKTVFSLYKVEIKDKERRFENLFHESLDGISDWKMERIVYDYIEEKLKEYISIKDDISETSRNVAFYPQIEEGRDSSLRIDMRPIYKEIRNALRYENPRGGVKMVNGVSVVDGEENVRFVIEAPIFNIEEIQKRLEEFVKENEGEFGRMVKEIKKKAEEIIEPGGYSVMMRSEFYGNPIFDRIFGNFGKRDHIRSESIEKGAARIMRTEYMVIDPKILRVKGRSGNGEAYLDEVKARREIGEILEKKKDKKLRDIFELVPDSCIEEADEIFSDVSELDSIKRAVEKWKELEAKDGEIREEKRLREQALKDLKEAIISAEKLGKSNLEVWDSGLKDEVTKALEHLNIMSADSKYKKKDIEEVEFNLIIRSKSLFNAYEEKARKEAEKKEEEKAEGDGTEKEAEVNKDSEEKPESGEEGRSEL